MFAPTDVGGYLHSNAAWSQLQLAPSLLRINLSLWNGLLANTLTGTFSYWR
jgi:hypothetical protein